MRRYPSPADGAFSRWQTILSGSLSRSLSLLMASCTVLLASCGSPDEAVPGSAIVQVQVIEVERRDVPVIQELVGTTLGTQDVPIRARVEGFLETMTFQEGSFVKQGTLLYTIDPQPFQAKVVEAQSQLAGAQTALAKAASDLARIRPLAEMKAVSEQDLDGAVAQEAAASAGVQAAEAGVELAEIELSYTRIHAPIGGRIGLTQARPGEFVGREPNPVVLNVLSDIDPIRVRFSISEREYLRLARSALVQQRMAEEEKSAVAGDRLELILADGSVHPQRGQLVAISQAINPETGTFTLEALFPNPKNIVLPGQFARVRAELDLLPQSAVVPRRAVTELQGRFRLYVVAADDTVEAREVELGPQTGNDQVILSGIEAGERVVVEGLQKIRPGMTVDPQRLNTSTSATEN